MGADRLYKEVDRSQMAAGPVICYPWKINICISLGSLSVIRMRLTVWPDLKYPYSWLIIYCFTFRSRIFHLWRLTTSGEGLCSLGLCSGPLNRKGFPVVPRGLGWGYILTRILTGPHSVASYDTHRDPCLDLHGWIYDRWTLLGSIKNNLRYKFDKIFLITGLI
jgi:hypothetical protein